MKQLGQIFVRYRKIWVTILILLFPSLIIAQALNRVSAVDTVEQATLEWEQSGHADFTSRSFNHWNNDDPPLIPANCAACHSLQGAMDFAGARAVPAETVAHDMPIGTVVSCAACHTGAAHARTQVTFPSGTVVQAQGSEASCLTCHMGTQSGVSVHNAISDLDADTVIEGQGFINVHYHVAAATLMGASGQGGYEFADLNYAGRYDHIPDYQTCTSCHNAHSLEVEPLACSTCHVNVTGPDTLRDIREHTTDYNGDGNTSQGIAYEIDDFHARLYAAIQLYAAEVVGTPIVYSSAHFPYFFVDISDGGEVDPATLNFGNRYIQWTPRLLRVAYNYHFVKKDAGAYAHNPHYVLQLLYDSLQDLDAQISVDMTGLVRPQIQ